MDEYLIGHALWNYKGLHFGIYDKNGKMVSKKTIGLFKRRK